MKCIKCGSENVLIQTEQCNAKTKTRKTGCLWSIGRACLIVCTLGLWLIIGKRKATSNTHFVNCTVAVCQNCGNKWEIKALK